MATPWIILAASLTFVAGFWAGAWFVFYFMRRGFRQTIGPLLCEDCKKRIEKMVSYLGLKG